MALPLPQDTADTAAEIIQELERSHGRSDAALRRAVPYAVAITPAVIETVEKAADGVYLLPKQQNLLYWGIHVLAAGRCTELCKPLLRLVRQPDHQYLDDIFGDSIAETLKQVLISVFDGDADTLLSVIADRNTESYVRWGLLEALARLTFDGAISRTTTLSFLDRFERESLADPGDPAWEGWQEAVIYLGFEELHERVWQAWNDGRIPEGISDRAFWERQIAIVRALAPGDPGIFDQEQFSPITDPVETLRWAPTDAELAERRKPRSQNRSLPDPAAKVALDQGEEHWLARFLCSKHAPNTAMNLEQVDGFFCALAAGPSVPAIEYMPVIWDTCEDPDSHRGPAYDSPEQAEYVLDLMTRHWNSIAQRLEKGYQHNPVLEHRSDELEARYWAGGFIRGVALRAKEWGAHGNSFVSEFLNTIVVLGTDEDHLAEAAIDCELRDKLVAALPPNLLRLHHLWRGQDDPFPPPTTTRYEGRKIGRNEPCPCGSGKKFKRCCGSPTKSIN